MAEVSGNRRGTADVGVVPGGAGKQLPHVPPGMENPNEPAPGNAMMLRKCSNFLALLYFCIGCPVCKYRVWLIKYTDIIS